MHRPLPIFSDSSRFVISRSGADLAPRFPAPALPWQAMRVPSGDQSVAALSVVVLLALLIEGFLH